MICVPSILDTKPDLTYLIDLVVGYELIQLVFRDTYLSRHLDKEIDCYSNEVRYLKKCLTKSMEFG